MSRCKILFASNPNETQAAELAADAAALIKARLEVEIGLDPRKPMIIGDLVAACRGLELTHQFRAQFTLPSGASIEIFAVHAKSGEKPAVYIGNELRLGADGKVVAQRLRSPESAEEFRNASTGSARNAKSANLFIANWRDESVIDREAAKRAVVLSFPSDMTAGVAYRLSWYTRSNMLDMGRVDLRPALSGLCVALDQVDAEAKAKADAEAKTKADAAETLKTVANELRHRRAQKGREDHFRTVALWRAACREAGIPGVGPRSTESEIGIALRVAAGMQEPAPVDPAPVRAIVTQEELAAIVIAVNTIDLDGGVNRLRKALRAAGVEPVLQAAQGVEVGGYKAALLQAAKRCTAAKTAAEVVTELDRAEVALTPVEA